VILVDTSVWVDHFRAGLPALVQCLDRFEVATHPFVIGDLALGNLRQREIILALLRALPAAPVADEEEVMEFIERRHLPGRGIGYVDAHLLSACHLAPGMHLWTRDKRLKAIAQEQVIGAALD
jgi:predicted nucleic acid-binding protein